MASALLNAARHVGLKSNNKLNNMKNTLAIIALAAAALVFTQTSQAVPITGTIGFSGTAQLDGSTVATSTQVVSWGTNTVGIASGSFAPTIGLQAILASPWFFNSGALNGFWTVGGFTFNMSSSSVFSNAGGFLTIVIAGTVTGNGYDATALAGRVTIQDPSTGNGPFTYTESLSFNSIPDGGSTVLLLGAALSGLTLMRRKLNI
jgi:hypothetical protein